MNETLRPRDARDFESFDETVDLLVVGLGCAGAAVVLEAADLGLSTMVLERGGGGGGTSSMSGGVIYLGGGTGLQKACGFEDSAEEMFKYLMASCGEAPDEAKIRLYCDGSVQHYEWFLRHGVPFKAAFYPGYSGEPPNTDGLVYSGTENAHPFDKIARPAPRGHVPEHPAAAGGFLMQKLIAAVEATDADVRTDTRCTALIQDRDGAIVGAIARTGDEERSIRARRGVALCAGGFINNPEMVRTHAPELGKCKFRVGAEGDDGSGIRLGVSAGGAVMNLSMGSISLPLTPPKSLIKGILVNGRGQRFINEDAYFGRLGEYAVYHAEGRAYLVLDGETFVPPDVEREIAGVGEDIAELEGALDLPEGSLASTLELYNRHAADGKDPVFGKAAEYVTPLKPPYGAYDCTTENSLYAAFTLGGLRTTVDGEVMDFDGKPIPGLFAAGRTTAAIACPGYASGISIGDGTFFGRRLAHAAADRGGA